MDIGTVFKIRSQIPKLIEQKFLLSNKKSIETYLEKLGGYSNENKSQITYKAGSLYRDIIVN